MKLLRRHNHLVLIIGLGVVGKAIYEQLLSRYDEDASTKLNWSSLKDCQTTTKRLLAENVSSETQQIDIIWSAGKTGFGASQEEADHDLGFFKTFVGFLSKLVRKRAKQSKIRFVLIGSAGGLFEGQTGISRSSVPDPQRPYGQLKLEQEEYIKSIDIFDEHALVRLSSVYSVTNLKSRMGLIPTMVSKSIRQEFMSIYGTEMTLRDYVLDSDIGRYVVEMLDHPLPGTVFVIDGKSYSILEIKNMLETVSGKKVYLNYALLKSNAANMSFSQDIRAKGFNPSNLATNIRLLHLNLLSGATQ